jgi:hypothetical protein
VTESGAAGAAGSLATLRDWGLGHTDLTVLQAAYLAGDAAASN